MRPTRTKVQPRGRFSYTWFEELRFIKECFPSWYRFFNHKVDSWSVEGVWVWIPPTSIGRLWIRYNHYKNQKAYQSARGI